LEGENLGGATEVTIQKFSSVGMESMLLFEKMMAYLSTFSDHVKCTVP
jgi:hypothetical protein